MIAVILGLFGILSVAIIGAAIVDIARRPPGPVVNPPWPANRIVLVGHGQTDWTESGKLVGVTQVGLTDEERRQASAVGERLAGWRFDEVYVSPLGPARATLALLKRPEPSTVLDDLTEWNCSHDEGPTTADLHESSPHWTVRGEGPGGGETITDVAIRCRRILRRVEGDVLLVAPPSLLRVFAACWLRIDAADSCFFALDPATICVLGREREHPVLTVWNTPPLTFRDAGGRPTDAVCLGVPIRDIRPAGAVPSRLAGWLTPRGVARW